MKSKIISGIFIVFAVMLFVSSKMLPENTKNNLTVVFINVGNADSQFIRFPDGKIALIDGGDTDNLREIQNVLFDYGVKTVDYMISSHPHNDHIGTFRDILKTYKVKNFYTPETPIESDLWSEIQKILEEKSVPVNIIKRGDIICDGDVKIEVLSPFDNYFNEENDYSAVCLLTHGENTFLFTGDAGAIVQNTLVYKYGFRDCDVLKIAHHGSRNSNSYGFLEEVKPKYAVISSSQDIKDSLKDIFSEFNIKYFSTKEGNITMISDGKNLEIRKENENEN